MSRTDLIRPSLAITTIVLAAASACGGSQDARSTPSASTAPPAIASPISPPVDATPLVEVTGLFSDRRSTRVDEQRSLGPKPAIFAPWDGKSTMLYDTQDGTQINLGPGSVGQFSPDGTNMVWIAGTRPPFNDGELMLVELATRRRESLGPGRGATFSDDSHLNITKVNSNDRELLNLRTGERMPAPPRVLAPMFPDVTTPDGYKLHREVRSDAPFLKNDWLLVDENGALRLRFEAYLAMPAGPGMLAVETVPGLSGPPDFRGRQGGTVNIFLVEIDTGRATFIATSGGTQPYWGLDANERYVVWPESYCGGSEGRTRLYDRLGGKITEFGSAPNPRFTPVGLLVVGTFHGVELIDPETLQYRSAIPSNGDSSWSSNYRYASIGQFGAHDGDC